MLTFAEVFDYYQAAVYPCRDVLAQSIARLITYVGSTRVLDCACGTGLPAIDLRALGVDVECTDADPAMLERFSVNARQAGTDGTARLLRWGDLASLPGPFGYVMCRGNSLAYADSWQAAVPAVGLGTVEVHLKAIAAAVAPGGYLHIDAPRDCRASAAAYPEVTFRGQRVKVAERVTVSGSSRRWDQRVTVGRAEYRFTRHSAALTGGVLAAMLPRAGFSAVETVDLPGERAAYHVLLARKD